MTRGTLPGQLGEIVTVLAEFGRYQRLLNLRPGTISRRGCLLRSLGEWLDVPLEDATTEHLEKYLATRRLEPQTRYSYISTLAVFYEWCVASGRAGVNPTEEMVRPRLPRLVPRPIPTDHLREGLRDADDRMRAWLLLGCFEGLRCFEMAGLDGRDVGDGLLFVADGKGGHQRVLPLHPAVLSALRKLEAPKRGTVFRSVMGRAFHPSTISGYVGAYFREHGWDHTCHQLRHWFASQVYAMTHDIRVVQELLGHRDVKTTSIYVAHDQQGAVEAVRGLTL